MTLELCPRNVYLFSLLAYLAEINVSRGERGESVEFSPRLTAGSNCLFIK